MKVLTLKQPWASLVANGYKKYEFRSWKTNYRGIIYIHAGSNIDKDYIEKYKDFNIDYPSKKIIAKAELVDCIKIDDDFNNKIIKMNNIVYGNKKRDGYAWVLKNIEKIKTDKEVKGKLGLWNYEE